MMAFNYGYNPMQTRVDSLMQQKQMIDQQLQSLQQMNVPPININNMTMPQNAVSNDGNFKWVENSAEAKQLATNSPFIFMDKNEPKFYMNDNGSLKTFRFEEVIEPVETSNNDRIDKLEGKLNDLIGVIASLAPLTDTNTNADVKEPKTSPKQAVKGGK